MAAFSGWGNLAKEYVVPSELAEHKFGEERHNGGFKGGEIPLGWYAPRISPKSFVSLNKRKGVLRLQGQESLSSLNKVSLLARKLTSVQVQVTTKMEFAPEIYQHYAGLVLYYDNMNYVMLRKYWSDTLKCPALGVLRLENGKNRRA